VCSCDCNFSTSFHFSSHPSTLKPSLPPFNPQTLSPPLPQAELDLRKIPIQQQPTCQCTLTLYVLMSNGQKEAGDFGELSVKVWLAHVGAEAPQILAPGERRGGSVGKVWEAGGCFVRKRVEVEGYLGFHSLPSKLNGAPNKKKETPPFETAPSNACLQHPQ
jgi:hypothetical protein